MSHFHRHLLPQCEASSGKNRRQSFPSRLPGWRREEGNKTPECCQNPIPAGCVCPPDPAVTEQTLSEHHWHPWVQTRTTAAATQKCDFPAQGFLLNSFPSQEDGGDNPAHEWQPVPIPKTSSMEAWTLQHPQAPHVMHLQLLTRKTPIFITKTTGKGKRQHHTSPKGSTPHSYLGRAVRDNSHLPKFPSRLMLVPSCNSLQAESSRRAKAAFTTCSHVWSPRSLKPGRKRCEPSKPS